MKEQTGSRVPKYRWVTALAGGYLIFLFILLGALVGLVLWMHRTQTPTPAGSPATPAVQVTSTPHILLHAPADKTLIRSEDFSTGVGNWSLDYRVGKVQVINRRLIAQSYTPGSSIAVTNQSFIPAADIYYVQADFMTDTDALAPYGLIFGSNNESDTYYLFDILPRSAQLHLLKHSPDKWNLLLSLSSAAIGAYPVVNTLSVYFHRGVMNLYINGISVATYTDSEPLHSSGVGVLATDSSYRLMVANFFAYSEP